jgi:hypothetical protein
LLVCPDGEIDGCVTGESDSHVCVPKKSGS